MALFRWVLHRLVGTSDSVGEVRPTLAQRPRTKGPADPQSAIRSLGDAASSDSHAVGPPKTLRTRVSPACGNGQILGPAHGVPPGPYGSSQTPPQPGAGQPGPAGTTGKPIESLSGRCALGWAAGGLGRRRHDHGRQPGDSPTSLARCWCAGGGRRGVGGCATRFHYDQGRRGATKIWPSSQARPE